MSALLDHDSPECVGAWLVCRDAESGESVIRCGRCNAERAATPENRAAADEESFISRTMFCLAESGAARIAQEQGGAP